ncbi:hypothetical protein [Paenibacillus sp. HB172176]|uniref:hypothetical protein n=1 Tax=Paenibacillus sp. HB172176 TaxID=2493690 RepID=UPI00143ABFB3|nr:hypothetical protein [Paenibacillus sp. HB172176]
MSRRKQSFSRQKKPGNRFNGVYLSLTAVLVLLIAAWVALDWQDGRGDGSVYASDKEDEPVIMLDLDANQSNPGAVNTGSSGFDNLGGFQLSPPSQDAGDKQEAGAGTGDETDREDLPELPQLPTFAPSQKPDTPDDEASPPQETAGPTKTPQHTSAPDPSREPEQTPAPTKTPTETEAPSESDAPEAPAESANGNESVDIVAKYEQQLVEAQAGCVQDMKQLLQKADTSFKGVDRTDTEKMSAIAGQLEIEFRSAETACENTFNSIIANAKKEGVPDEQIEEWQQTFKEMREKLREEAELRVQQIIFS